MDLPVVADATNYTVGSSGAMFIQWMVEDSFHSAADSVAKVFDFVARCVSLPLLCAMSILLPFLAGTFRALKPFVQSWWTANTAIGGMVSGPRYIRRNIEVRLPPYNYVNLLNHNLFLQNAVLVYVCDQLWRKQPLSARMLGSNEMLVELIDPYRSWRSNVPTFSPFKAGAPVTRTLADQDPPTFEELNRLRMVRVPHQTWLPVRVDDIEMSYKTKTYVLAGYNQPWTRHTLTLRCKATPGAAARLDGFVQRALEAFAENAPGKEESDARWLFAYSGESGNKVFFHQYVLRSNKGFDTLFFPQREATLTLIDQFVQRRGRFAVEGFPQKLGFLLYGPRGTGRHTFVKALAAYTGRHIVSVPLSKLRTNQQLYDIFFVREFQSEEEGSVQRLRMEDVIFLFDDVDASEPVVCARAARRVVQRRGAARLTAREDGGGGALTNCVIEMDTSSSRRVLNVEESALPLAMLMDLVLGSNSCEGGVRGEKEDGAGGTGGGKKGKRGAAAGGGAKGIGAGVGTLGGHLFGINDILSGENKDALDLAGLLNVLDGVVDAPGRMVVMITEHPEWLDPALIRPGRFSVRLRFDYIEMAALVSMLGLYYGDVVHAGSDESGGTAVAAANSTAAGSATAASATAAAAEARARAARAVHRELSDAQATRVRAAVAALEAEASARGDGCEYRFHVTPCEVELLCMDQDTLDGFLSQLGELVRGTLTL